MKIFKEEKESLGLFLLSLLVLFFFQLGTVYGGDSGDYLSAAGVWGNPHPPGYPLYTFIAGCLHNFFSFSTPAWRVALLSSVSSAAAIFLFYKLQRFFLSKKISLLSSLSLLFLYPFWLYSEVVEVFSLASLFIVLLSYLLILIIRKKKYQLLKLFFFVFGLSLTHHHTVLFLLPGVIYLFKQEKLFEHLKLSHGIFFLAGLLPYLYSPIAALANPPINWENPRNLGNFLSMVSRAKYGTFLATKDIENSLLGRFLALFSFLKFLISDFRFVGSGLVGLGIIRIIKEKKKILKYFLISFTSYILLIVYASFPLTSDFQVATFERFLIAPYLFACLLLGFGTDFLHEKLETFELNRKKLVKYLFIGVLFVLLPFSSFLINYPKIKILKNDFTAEKFTKDLLDTVEKNGVLVARSDTTFFNISYLYYSLGYRDQEVKFLSPYHLQKKNYKEYLKNRFPELNLKELENDEDELFTWRDFVMQNYSQVPIYTIPKRPIEGFKQIPIGLLYRYYREEDIPETEKLIEKNNQLREKYADPLQGSLGEFENLFLAHLLKYYQETAQKWTVFLLNNDQIQEAEKYLQKSLYFGNEKDFQYHLLQGRVYLGKKECQKAEKTFKKLANQQTNSPFPDAYLRQVYLKCYEDEEKAKEYLNSCLDKESKQRIQLEE